MARPLAPHSAPVMNEAHGARVSLGGPREMASTMPNTQSMQRQNSSTAQLIRRYEQISGSSAGSSSFPPSSSQMAQDTSSNGQLVRLKRGRRSISDSLRNLLSAFRKGKNHGKGTDMDWGKSTKEHNPALLRTSSCSKGSTDHHDPSCTNYMSEELARPVYSGILLYFARPALASDSPVSRVWTTCKVTLFPSHLLVTWFTSQGNPASHPIPLVSATNAQPIAFNELKPEEKALLPVKSDEDGTKVFEISFKGAAGEMFAATSVPERVKWVNMLCDAIMPLHESTSKPLPTDPLLRRDTEHFPENIEVVDETLSVNSPPSASAYSTSLYPPSTTTAEGMTTDDVFDHSLPPTPYSVETNALVDTPTASFRTSVDKQTHALPSPLPKSPSPATSPSINPQTASCPKSPSIIRLDNLSVVRQRLAQMEGSSPHARSASRELETRTNASTTPKSTRIKRAFQEIDELEEKYNSEKERSDGLLKKPALPPLVIPDFRLQSSLTTVQTLRVSSPSLSTREDSAGPVSDSAAKIISAPRHFSPDMSLKVELLQKLMEQASDQRYHQSRGIVELVGHLREDVQSLPEVLGKLIGTVDAGDSNSSVHLVETLHAIESRLIETLANSEKAQSVTVTQQADETRAKIDSVMADVLQRLTILQGFATRTSVQDADNGMMTMKDLPEPPAAGVDANNITGTNHDARHDLTGIRDKLDNLLELVKTKCTASETERGQASGAPEAISSDNLPGPCGEQLQEILDHLKEEGERAKYQEEQQSESLRYLNELNSWLDTFVNNGTTQIQSIATTMQRLSEELGCENIQPSDGQAEGQKAGLLITVRELLEAHSSSLESTKQLQTNVEDLVVSVQTQFKHSAEQQNALVTDSVVGLVNQQRAEQEQMLRALSSELTEEIRGERLRFVEAMKEATAINVQAHVEHFKAELTREVMTMTEEVGRLHRQKQILEQQIAELFTFYSKRKTDAEKVMQQEQALPRRQTAAVVQSMQNIPPSRTMKQRPLPAPFSRLSER